MRQILIFLFLVCLAMCGCNRDTAVEKDGSEEITNYVTVTEPYSNDETNEYTEANEIITQESLADYDSDGIEDCLYYILEKDSKDYYLHLTRSSDGSTKIEPDEDLFIGEIVGMDTVEIVVDDITMDGSKEILIKMTKSTTGGIVSSLSAYKLTSNGIEEVIFSNTNRELQFTVSRYLNMTEIECADVNFYGRYWAPLYSYSFGLWIPEGKTSWVVSPSEVDLVEKDGEKIIEYTYKIGKGSYIPISAYVSYKDGAEKVVSVENNSIKMPFDIVLLNESATEEPKDYAMNDEEKLIREISELIHSSGNEIPFLVRILYNNSRENYTVSVYYKTGEKNILEEQLKKMLSEYYGEDFCEKNSIECVVEEVHNNESDGELIYSLPLRNNDYEVKECEPLNWDEISIIDDESLFEVWGSDIHQINQISPWVGGTDLKPLELVIGECRYSAALQEDTYIVKGNPVTGARSLYLCKGDKAVEIDWFYSYGWDESKIWKYDINGDGHEEYIKAYSDMQTKMGEVFKTGIVYILDTANLRAIEFENSDELMVEMAQKLKEEYLSCNEKKEGYNFYLGFTDHYTYGFYKTGEKPTMIRKAWLSYGPDEYCTKDPQYKPIGMVSITYEYDEEQDRMSVVSYDYSEKIR